MKVNEPILAKEMKAANLNNIILVLIVLINKPTWNFIDNFNGLQDFTGLVFKVVFSNTRAMMVIGSLTTKDNNSELLYSNKKEDTVEYSVNVLTKKL